MKPVIKYKTFEDLKSSGKAKLNAELSLKRHGDLEKFIKEIRYVKTHKNNPADTKQ